MTPEGKVKKKVTSLLTQYADLYYYMPVPGGFGKPSLDYIGCHRGQFFAIETKTAGKKLTLQQVETARQMRAAGGVVFEVIGDDGLEELARWLKGIDDAHGRGNLDQT
jgi:hypothetical protein